MFNVEREECGVASGAKSMTIAAFGAIIDIWNISIYIHIMDINTRGCIPPNKIPWMTIVAFGGIIDIWNISIYIHIMDTNITGCIPPNKIP